jgi:hypothetical protein
MEQELLIFWVDSVDDLEIRFCVVAAIKTQGQVKQ